MEDEYFFGCYFIPLSLRANNLEFNVTKLAYWLKLSIKLSIKLSWMQCSKVQPLDS